MSLPSEPAMRFDDGLEVEYLRARLSSGRTLIRMASVLGLVVILLRIAELAATGIPGPVPRIGAPLFAGLVLTTSSALAVLACTGLFMRWYLPVATVLVPLRNCFVGFAIGAAAARGDVELLMVLPAMVISPFFFLGLQFRAALVSVTLTLLAFALSALAFSLPLAMLLRSLGFLSVSAAIVAVAAWQLEKQSRRSFLERRLVAEFAEHDALTGAKNRRVFDEHLVRLWQQAVDDGRRLAILLIDVDCFKAYNDRYGHQAGDIALQRVAWAVKARVGRPLDLLSRYGGEEFAALLYDMDARQATELAEQMRLAVAALHIEHRDSEVADEVTISIGVSAIRPRAERKPAGALQLADEALYAAKVAGRNRVHLASETDYGNLQTGVFAQHAAGA